MKAAAEALGVTPPVSPLSPPLGRRASHSPLIGRPSSPETEVANSGSAQLVRQFDYRQATGQAGPKLLSRGSVAFERTD